MEKNMETTIQGLGFRVQDLGLRVWDLGFGVKGSGGLHVVCIFFP